MQKKNIYDYSQLKECGEDVFISEYAEIKRPELVEIGNHVAIDSGVYMTTSANIGDYVHIAPQVTIIGGATGCLIMEDFSGISAGCRIVCGSDNYLGDGLTGPTVPKEYQASLSVKPVTLKKHAVLGTNVVVMPGVIIGEGAVVGACSLVTRDLEPWAVYVGIPAKKVKDRPRDVILTYARKMGY